MLIGAVAGFSTAVATGNPWLGVVVAMLAGGLLSLVHGVVTIHFRADQVVSGLALTFLGTGPRPGPRRGPVERRRDHAAAAPDDPGPVGHPGPRPDLLPRPERPRATSATCSCPLAWFWIDRTRPGLHLRAVGERPSAADAQGIDVYRHALRLRVRRRDAGRPGRRDDHARDLARLVRRPDRQRTRLDRRRARHLRPVEPAPGRVRGLLFGAIFRFILDIQGVADDPRRREPVPGRPLGDVLPRDAAVPDGHPRRRSSARARRVRKRVGAPAALGRPYVRGERGG